MSPGNSEVHAAAITIPTNQQGSPVTDASILGFLLDPFDPVRNVRLFSRFIDPHLPSWLAGCEESLDATISALESWQELYPDVKFPHPDELRAVWGTLGPRAQLLAAYHDTHHALRKCAQDVAGEYELATLMLIDPDWNTDRLYGALTLLTLPLGALRSPDGITAPARGVARALIRKVLT